MKADECCKNLSLHINLYEQKPPGLKEDDEPEEEEEDELGHAETYAEYMPMKCKHDCCVGGGQTFEFAISSLV